MVKDHENIPSDLNAPALIHPLNIGCHPTELESTLLPILRMREVRHKVGQGLA